jgi:hypothetical protein
MKKKVYKRMIIDVEIELDLARTQNMAIAEAKQYKAKE